MPEPTIVPPPAVVKQGEPIDTSPGLEQMQAVFDRVLPEIRGTPTVKSPPEQKPEKAPEKPVAPSAEAAEPESKPPEKPAQKPAEESHEIPSFLEQALKGEPSQEATPAEDEWPEELPDFKNSAEAKERYKKWRAAYGGVKDELKSLREKPTLDANQLARLESLEGENQRMRNMLTHVGVQQSEEFQNNVLRPLTVAWNEAARIVKDAGGNPNNLAKAMTLSGKAQFEALDDLFREMPESAKAEAHDALRTYRRYEETRKAILANAPAALEGIRKREGERQMAELNRQRADMGNIFDQAVASLTNGKVEVFLTADSADGKWWNEQRENIVKQGRELFLENTDMGRVAMACLLASSADAYRKLWLRSQKKIAEQNEIIKSRIDSEPDLSEHGGPGNIIPAEQQLEADLKLPFEKVFLREFHKAQGQNRR